MARILILGASGSGVTTLGRALSQTIGIPCFDSDDYFWRPSDPPFVNKRPSEEREALLHVDCAPGGRWILSGSILMWELQRMPPFSHIVYLWVPPATRMARLAAREQARFGEKILPGGPMHEEHTAFMSWAAAYDTAGPEQRSRALHDQWLASHSVPTLKIEGDTTVDERMSRVISFVK